MNFNSASMNRFLARAANRSQDQLALTRDNREVLVQAGSFLSSAEEIGDLVVGAHQGRPVFLRDVAEVREGPDQPEQYVWLGTGPEAIELPVATRHVNNASILCFL